MQAAEGTEAGTASADSFRAVHQFLPMGPVSFSGDRADFLGFDIYLHNIHYLKLW